MFELDVISDDELKDEYERIVEEIDRRIDAWEHVNGVDEEYFDWWYNQ